jgi:hypothetical protein
MIDDELRTMFAEREALAPAPTRSAQRIAAGIPLYARRVRRRRVVALAGVLGAALVAVLLVPMASGHRAPEPADRPSGGVSGSPVPSDEPDPDRLAPAPAVGASLEMTPGWLPAPAESARTFARVDVDRGTRSVAYEFLGAGPVSSVEIATAASEPDSIPNPDERPVDIRGRSGKQLATVHRSQGERTCLVSWRENDALWFRVFVGETGRTPSCEVAVRVARNLADRPLALPRPVRLGLVPSGYLMVETGNQREAWCPGGGVGNLGRCLVITRGADVPARAGRDVTVRGRPGWLERTGREIRLVVPDFLMITFPEDGADYPLDDDDLIRMAESAELARGW